MTLPNCLTVFRILVIMPFAACFFFEEDWIQSAKVGLYAAACVTDYFDGFLARALGQATHFGRFLDPIADKLLIGATLLLLVGGGVVHGLALIPAIIILSREILVSGLREFLMEVRVSLPVSRMAKWKTAIQMVSLGMLLTTNVLWCDIGMVLFWIAAMLTLITGYDYLKSSLRHFKDQES